jgi:hypothetical protein
MNLNLNLEWFVRVVPLYFKRVNDAQLLLESEPMKQGDYLHQLNSFVYLTKIRPEIANAVSFVGTYEAKPTRAAFDEMSHFSRYLRDTSRFGLVYKVGIPGRLLVFEVLFGRRLLCKAIPSPIQDTACR